MVFYNFTRVGRGRWPMELASDGRIAEGWTIEFHYWWFDDSTLVLEAVPSRPTSD